jgi:hypothetical protein
MPVPKYGIEYNETHPKIIAEHMAKGHTFEGACGRIGISRSKGYKWSKLYPEFAEAKETGMNLRLGYYERIAQHALHNAPSFDKRFPHEKDKDKGRKINITMLIFLLKSLHRDLYGDKWTNGDKDKSGIENLVFSSRIGDGGQIIQEIKSRDDWEKQKTFDVQDVLNDIKQEKDKTTKPNAGKD